GPTAAASEAAIRSTAASYASSPSVPAEFSGSGLVIASGSELAGTAASDAGSPTVTSPAPARIAPRAASTGAPGNPCAPPRIATRPNRPLWLILGGAQGFPEAPVLA